MLCTWIGNNDGCKNARLPYRFYCAEHYDKVYISLPAKMAEHILSKELNSGNCTR